MPGPLWTPSTDRVARANLTRFGQGRPYADLYEWSITKPLEFWDAMWEFGGVVGRKGSRVAVDMDRMPGARFFPDATLNFAENVLRGDGDPSTELPSTELRACGAGDPAIICKSENGTGRTTSWRELRAETAAFAAALRAAGIRPGDRVAAVKRFVVSRPRPYDPAHTDDSGGGAACVDVDGSACRSPPPRHSVRAGTARARP